MLMQEVVRISDQFGDAHHPESIDRQERLNSCVALVTVFYLILAVAFATICKIEKPHRAGHPDPNVAFLLEFTQPAPPKPVVEPKPVGLIRGANTGGQAAASQKSLNPAIPSVANEADPVEEPPQKRVDRKVPVEAPVSVERTNEIAPQSKVQPLVVAELPATAAGNTSVDNGSVNDNAVGASVNDHGHGRQGKGDNTSVGNGDEIGFAGGQPVVAMRPPTPKVALGNIRPYTNSVLQKIAMTWHPTRKREQVIIALVIGSEGQLINSELVEAPTRKAGIEALAAVSLATFDPLPEWYQGQTLSFHITLDAVLSAK